MTRKVPLANEEIYHVYNRGVDKRAIFMNRSDVERFLQSMLAFNSRQPIGSLRQLKENRGKNSGPTAVNNDPLVEIICYCLNPNHFHLILRQVADGGISEYMKRLSGGYTWYFNKKHKRSGSLFQGKFKSSFVGNNEYLLHVSVYVNLNFRVHRYSGRAAELVRSSWDEYMGNAREEFCQKEIILGQFRNVQEYEHFAEQSLKGMVERKQLAKDLFEES